MRRLAIVVLSFGVISCASYDSIRDRTPDRVDVFKTERVALGSCVLDRARAKWGASNDMLWVDLPTEGTSRIVARYLTMIGSPTSMVQWDVTLRSQPDGSTRTEIRAPSSVWGTPLFPSELPAVMTACSAPAA